MTSPPIWTTTSCPEKGKVTNMTITTLQTILLTAIILIWLCFSVVFLITSIQSAIYDRKREKREREQAARDLEYHQKRMKDYN